VTNPLDSNQGAQGGKERPQEGQKDQEKESAALSFDEVMSQPQGASSAHSTPDSKGLGFAIGQRGFVQPRKSEFAGAKTDKPLSEVKPIVEKFLSDTTNEQDPSISAQEQEELTKRRDFLAQANSVDEVLSNALHLARLYQHLQYIEEAKKATELSLGIDPEHMLGKELFKQLERTHPVDIGISEAIAAQYQLTKSALRRRIRALCNGKVIVLGDLLIDELLEGKPERISREAPVLILEHVDTVLVPGGAANAAHNVTALGGKCHAIGVCGHDEYAHKLARLLEDHNITHSLVEDPLRPTTVKTRILSKSHSLLQQLLRLDRISHEPIDVFVESKIIDKLRHVVGQYNAIILSDYRGGVITDGVIHATRQVAKGQKSILIVDAQEKFERFHGCTLITPNQPDAEAAVGFSIKSKEDLNKAGQDLLALSGVQSLLITRGADGMVLFEQGQEMFELPAFNRSDVFDVTGAGDTVVAVMALALVSGSTCVEAMALGNLAAGIVVRKSGTAVTTSDEMIENLELIKLPE
jgi:rfaE bifunctional protein kinase chain/domain